MACAEEKEKEGEKEKKRRASARNGGRAARGGTRPPPAAPARAHRVETGTGGAPRGELREEPRGTARWR